MRPVQFHVVRDIERTFALALAVAFTFALMLGAVAPATGAPESRPVTTWKCERDEPGLAIPVEPPAAGPSCPSESGQLDGAPDSTTNETGRAGAITQ